MHMLNAKCVIELNVLETFPKWDLEMNVSRENLFVALAIARAKSFCFLHCLSSTLLIIAKYILRSVMKSSVLLA